MLLHEERKDRAFAMLVDEGRAGCARRRDDACDRLRHRKLCWLACLNRSLSHCTPRQYAPALAYLEPQSLSCRESQCAKRRRIDADEAVATDPNRLPRLRLGPRQVSAHERRPVLDLEARHLHHPLECLPGAAPASRHPRRASLHRGPVLAADLRDSRGSLGLLSSWDDTWRPTGVRAVVPKPSTVVDATRVQP